MKPFNAELAKKGYPVIDGSYEKFIFYHDDGHHFYPLEFKDSKGTTWCFTNNGVFNVLTFKNKYDLHMAERHEWEALGQVWNPEWDEQTKSIEKSFKAQSETIDKIVVMLIELTKLVEQLKR